MQYISMMKEEGRVINFGCRLNAYESQIIQNILDKNNQENVIVFNSCAVTSEAEKKLTKAIKKISKENPQAKIIVSGCAAQIDPVKFSAMTEVDLVLGNEEKLHEKSYINTSEKNFFSKEQHISTPQDKIFFAQKKKNQNLILKNIADEEKILVNDIMSIKETASHMVSFFDGKSRAFVQIQNGCNHRCTFCVIPYGRGNNRSVPAGEVISQIRNLLKNGYNEVVLTGVDITDYGKDLPIKINFSKLVKKILELVPELPRLRFSSVDVAEIDSDIFDLLRSNNRLMPYFHISLQSGDDVILKRMKRRHNRKQVLDFCHEIRKIRPEAAFGSDIIAGFPTEDDAMFDNSYNLIKEANLVFNHIFPYSVREGTPAARMPQVKNEIKKQRAKKLRDITQELHQKALELQAGKYHNIVVEKGGVGRTENFFLVKLNSNYEVGSVINKDVVIKDNYLITI
jgi:threonylcarbamoyladenosine tRNA methylthiotransferase MtaB